MVTPADFTAPRLRRRTKAETLAILRSLFVRLDQVDVNGSGMTKLFKLNDALPDVESNGPA